MKLCGVVVQIISNLLVFKLDFLKIFLIVKLSEALKNLTGLTTAWDLLYDPRREKWQSFQDFYRRLRKS